MNPTPPKGDRAAARAILAGDECVVPSPAVVQRRHLGRGACLRLGPGLVAVALLDPERDHRLVRAATDVGAGAVQHRWIHPQRSTREDDAGKSSTANFFTLHYGIFHLAYLGFLLKEHPVGDARTAVMLLACGVSFVLSQRETFSSQHAADLRGRPNLGTLMFTPYLRVVPMHLAILLGANAGGGAALWSFCGLKTASDLLLDRIDRRIAIKSADRAVAAA